MRVDHIRWKGWDAVRCRADECELVIGVSAGPRILSLQRRAGPNLLYEDTTDFHVGDWRLHGGHRFTVAPEGEESYAPENAPCSVEHRGEELLVAAPVGGDGIQRVLAIRRAGDGSGFDVRHVLRNQGGRPWIGAIWAITCVPCAGTVVAPLPAPQLRFWPDAAHSPWQVAEGHVAVIPDGSRGKAGWHSDEGWIASLQRDATLVIHAPAPPPPHECVDGGCNLEVFTCSHYVELETLGGKIVLNPGAEASHLERWRLLDPVFQPTDWQIIGRMAGCPDAETEPHHDT